MGQPITIDSGIDALAYSLYFLPEHFLKPHLVLNELFSLRPELRRDGLKVLDIGCGPGTATWALLELLKNRSIPQCTLVDRSKPLLEKASEIGRSYGVEINAINMNTDSGLGSIAPFSLAIFCNFLSETPKTAASLVESALKGLEPGGACVIIEPASDHGLETLTLLRTRYPDNVIAPCPFSGPCPAIATKGQICHFDISQKIPEELFRVVNAGHRKLKFGYLVLGKEPVENTSTASSFRLIEGFEKQPWGYNGIACDGRFFGPVKVRARDLQSRRFIEKLGSGDIIEIVEPLRKGDAMVTRTMPNPRRKFSCLD